MLAPCFIAIVLAVIGFYASCHWATDIHAFWEKWSVAAAEMLMSMLPDKWKFDRVDDEDLADEGVKTYARQAIFFAST